MLYQGKEIEILSRKSVFGKQIAEVKILSTGEVTSVPFSELSDVKKVPTDAEIAFKAIAAKIKSEVFKQAMLAPIDSNMVPLQHQIMALEKVMLGQLLRFLIADEVLGSFFRQFNNRRFTVQTDAKSNICRLHKILYWLGSPPLPKSQPNN
jgi:hypothetical protein